VNPSAGDAFWKPTAMTHQRAGSRRRAGTGPGFHLSGEPRNDLCRRFGLLRLRNTVLVTQVHHRDSVLRWQCHQPVDRMRPVKTWGFQSGSSSWNGSPAAFRSPTHPDACAR
jgi:hypothetical protein